MIDISFTTWFPVATLVTGYIMKAVSDRVEHSRTLERERESRAETRRIQVAERRVDFQRQTLLDLQQALFDFARAAGQGYMADRASLKKTGNWQKELLPEGLSDQIFATNRKCLMLGARVYDDSIRKLVGDFRDCTNNISMSPNQQKAEEQFQLSIKTLDVLNKAIGDQLRELDTEQ